MVSGSIAFGLVAEQYIIASSHDGMYIFISRKLRTKEKNFKGHTDDVTSFHYASQPKVLPPPNSNKPLSRESLGDIYSTYNSDFSGDKIFVKLIKVKLCHTYGP